MVLFAAMKSRRSMFRLEFSPTCILAPFIPQFPSMFPPHSKGYAMTKRSTFRGLALFTLVCAAVLAGCDTIPPPGATLQGEWELVKASDPGGENKIVLEIDDQGRVASVTNFVGGTSFRQDNATGDVTLDGLDVLIKTSTNLKFDGVFNSGITEAVGTQYTEFTILGITTTIDNGAATLSRI